MFKQLLFLLAFIFLSFSTFSQKAAPKTFELGVFLGRSYYLGELNPKTHLGNEVGSFAFGGLLRYNLNRRYSLRAGLNFGALRAEDEDVPLPFNQYRQASFESNLAEGHVLLEFNFMPYELGDPQYPFSPYLYVGPAFYINNAEFEQEGITDNNDDSAEETEEKSNLRLALPFGFGFKLNVLKRIGLSFEWGFRKANDELDALPNLKGETFENGKEYDNDWYSFSGFILTYKLSKKGPCPAIY